MGRCCLTALDAGPGWQIGSKLVCDGPATRPLSFSLTFNHTAQNELVAGTALSDHEHPTARPLRLAPLTPPGRPPPVSRFAAHCFRPHPL
jgi:hypothetical protein